MYAIGIVVATVNHPNFDYAVSINGIAFLVKNAEDVVIEEGQPVIVQYEPADQFCAVVPFEKVQLALDYAQGLDRFEASVLARLPK